MINDNENNMIYLNVTGNGDNEQKMVEVQEAYNNMFKKMRDMREELYVINLEKNILEAEDTLKMIELMDGEITEEMDEIIKDLAFNLQNFTNGYNDNVNIKISDNDQVIVDNLIKIYQKRKNVVYYHNGDGNSTPVEVIEIFESYGVEKIVEILNSAVSGEARVLFINYLDDYSHENRTIVTIKDDDGKMIITPDTVVNVDRCSNTLNGPECKLYEAIYDSMWS